MPPIAFGAESTFLKFTALQTQWQVRLLMYSSERFNTRPTHIQCSSSPTSGRLTWSHKVPCEAN